MSLNTVPFNPFPPSSEQHGSGGGGGSYVLPAATAETLGGIKVGDNLTVGEDGTLNAADPYTLPIAADDTLGGVKVGSGLSIDSETGALSADSQMVDYSTTEQATGQKWIDGKTIYRKVFNFGALPDTSYKELAIGANVDSIISIHGVTTDGNGVFLPIPYISSQASYGIGASVENGNVRITTWVNRTDYDTTFVIVEYTKSETEE